MKIVVSGANGFIGSNLVELALSAGHQILGIRKSEDSKTKIFLKDEPIWLNKKLSEIKAAELENYDGLIHLAAHSANVPYDTLENCLKVNLFDSLKFLKKAHRAGIKNFIIAGSCFEYGKNGTNYQFIPPNAALEPTQSYPASKAAASITFSQWAIENSIKLSIMRIFQVYGKGEASQRLWPSLIKAAKNGDDFEMTKGEQVRDFIDVRKVSEILLNECLNQENKVIIKNIGSGDVRSIADFASEIWKANKAKGKLIFGAKDYREGEVFRYVPDINSTFILKNL